MTAAWLPLTLLALLAARVAPAQFSGSIDEGSGLLYIGKFAFKPNEPDWPSQGKITYEVSSNKPGDSQNFFVGYFLQDQWDAAYEVDGCHAACVRAQCTHPDDLGTNSLRVDVAHTQFVFLGVYADKDLESHGITISYDAQFLQGDGSQVGANESGLMAVYIIFTVLWALGLGGQLYAVMVLRRKQQLHPLVKIYTVAITLWFLFVFSNMIHWSVYTSDGEGVPAMQGIGRVGEALARATFLLLLLLIAQGWTISTSVLLHKWRLLGAVGSVLVVYLALAIWYLAGRDPASTTYVYDSAPGIILCVLSGLIGVWFVFRVFRSFKNEIHTEKRKLYVRFGIVYAFYFLSLPIFVIIGAAIPPYEEEKDIESVVLAFTSAWFVLMGYVLWPSRASQLFEMKTDQFAMSAAEERRVEQFTDLQLLCGT